MSRFRDTWQRKVPFIWKNLQSTWYHRHGKLTKENLCRKLFLWSQVQFHEIFVVNSDYTYCIYEFEVLVLRFLHNLIVITTIALSKGHFIISHVCFNVLLPIVVLKKLYVVGYCTYTYTYHHVVNNQKKRLKMSNK